MCWISWARMAASSSSLPARSTMPRVRKMMPPGAENALASVVSSRLKW